MAKDKKSFLVYCDLIHTVKKMRKEDVGELFLHLLEYTNDLNPKTDNMIVDIVFEPIKQQLKRDLVAYGKSIEDSSINGRVGNLKRWSTDLFTQYKNKEITLEEAESIATLRKVSPPDEKYRPLSLPIANVAVTDTVNVTDTVKDTVKGIVIDIKNISLTLENDFLKFWNIYNKKTDSKKCKDKFMKLHRKEVEKILEVVQEYVNSTPDVQFRKNPLTWLNGKCWNDIEKNEYSPTAEKPFGKTNQI